MLEKCYARCEDHGFDQYQKVIVGFTKQEKGIGLRCNSDDSISYIGVNPVIRL